MKSKGFGVLLALLVIISACGGSGSSSGGGSSSNVTASFSTYMAGASVAAGSTDIGTDAIFVATFSSGVSASTLEENFFIVEGAKSNTANADYDSSICNTANAITARAFDCGGSESSATSCKLETQTFLTPNTQYILCISNSLKDADGLSFSGATVTFATANDSLATDSCTDTAATAIKSIIAMPFSFDETGYMTRFRSCTGHSFQDSLEPTPYTNQKHYIAARADIAECNDDVAVYAVFDGVILATVTDSDEPDCDESTLHTGSVTLQSSTNPRFVMNYGDVNPYTGITAGVTVTAGQRIATANFVIADSTWDLHFATVLYADSESGMPTYSTYSHCEIGAFLSDDVAATFTAHDASSSDMKFTKAYREEHNCTIDGQEETGEYGLQPAAGETTATQKVTFTQ